MKWRDEEMDFDIIRREFSSKADAALITSEVNRLYLTGFAASDGFLLITEKKAIFFTDARYIEAAQEQVKNCDEVLLYQSMEESLLPVLQREGLHTLEAESDRLTVSALRMLREKLATEILSDGGLDAAIDSLRAVKDDAELHFIRQAQHIAGQAFAHILEYIEPGMTEKQIAAELDYYMLGHGADAISFETIAVSGCRTSLPHGVPSGKTVEDGDFITMDFGAVVGGYHSDMTRTIALGYVTGEQRAFYDVVARSQAAALAVLRPGVEAAAADKAARQVIEDAGYGAYFSHSLGHGVGVEIHENPNLSPKSKAVLVPGNVVTVEPGIYIPGLYGARIEDMALITDEGCEDLTDCDKELIIL